MSSYWELVTFASEEMLFQNPDRTFTQADYDIVCNILETSLMKKGSELFPCTNSRVSLLYCKNLLEVLEKVFCIHLSDNPLVKTRL